MSQGKPGEEQPDNCPTCGERWVRQARGPGRRRTCPNGHQWSSKKFAR